MSADDWRGRKVLVTGHTGFKGSWLCIMLNHFGAKVIGFSLPEHDNDYVYKKTRVSERIFADEKGDINNLDELRNVFEKHQPEAVFHLAAQAIVLKSYDEPLNTFITNAIGTANVLECIRKSKSVKAAVLITTDKCYKNLEKGKPFTEDDELGGKDPYSTSKACAELMIKSYRGSFFKDKLVASARAGNVIGGGDYAANRILTDCITSLKSSKPIIVRNPSATRPWQHVIEPDYGYILLAEKLLQGRKEFAKAYNFGPELESNVPVKAVAQNVVNAWGSGTIECPEQKDAKYEAKLLMLDISKAKKEIGFRPRWNVDKAIEKSVEWYKKAESEDAYALCISQIKEYLED